MHTALKFPKLISIQNSYSLLNRCDIEAGLIEVCSKRSRYLSLLKVSPFLHIFPYVFLILLSLSFFLFFFSRYIHHRNENIGLLAYSPLAGGILTGKYALSNCSPTSRLNLFQGYMSRYKQSLAQQAVGEYVSLAERYELTPAELALAWCYSRAHVTATIIGATSLVQLEENIQVDTLLLFSLSLSLVLTCFKIKCA